MLDRSRRKQPKSKKLLISLIKSKKLSATRHLEFVCFFPIEVPTSLCNAVAFTALDVYSKELFLIGIEAKSNNDSVLKHIELLMENKEFKLHRDKGFTLVFHKYNEIQIEIEKIIKPFGGKMLIDSSFVSKEFIPVKEHIIRLRQGL